MATEKCTLDIHTHILPCMDDGASSVEESLKLAALLSKQGITSVAATPHFYADRDNPSEFFERRQRSVSKLTEKLDFDFTVLPGAEVCYYQGISQTERLPEFAIGQTKLILIEMPFADWTSSVINEIYSIVRDRRLGVIIAHIDRYISRNNIEYVEEMLDLGVLFQINASAFLEKKRRNEALDLLRCRMAHFVASDCHNISSRPPRLDEAYAVIEKKLGPEYLDFLSDNSKEYF